MRRRKKEQPAYGEGPETARQRQTMKLTVKKDGEVKKEIKGAASVWPGLIAIQRMQSQSFAWAYKWEGWRLYWEDEQTGEKGEVLP
jgi:hypothetical protein